MQPDLALTLAFTFTFTFYFIGYGCITYQGVAMRGQMMRTPVLEMSKPLIKG